MYFIYFWLRWVFVAEHWLSVVAASRGYSSLRCVGFSLRWLLITECSLQACSLQQLWHAGSVVVALRLSSCGARAQLLCGIWDLPGPGLEPVSPALAGGFLTTAPPGKPPISQKSLVWQIFKYYIHIAWIFLFFIFLRYTF